MAIEGQMSTEKASNLGRPAIDRPDADDSTQRIENGREPAFRRASSPPREDIQEADQYMETERADAVTRPIGVLDTVEVEGRVEDATMVLDSNRFNDSPGENTAKQSFGPPNQALGPSEPK